jgi:outer membrane protein TolC
MTNFLSVIIIFSCLLSNVASAKTVALHDVLHEILNNSNVKKSAEYSLKASESEALEADKHWLPTLYLDSSFYKTNDPTKNFIGNLYQRSIRQSDFEQNVINKTANGTYSKSAVGVNLPLYEGGAGIANRDIAKNMVVAKKYDLKQVEINQYAYATSNYIALVSLQEQKIRLKKIAKNIDEILKKYALGNKKNQVGYSGLLILQVSENKTKSFIIDNEEKTKALYATLRELGFASEIDWSVNNLPVNDYLNKYLKFELETDSSFKISALKAKVDADKNKEKIENGKNLPKLNLFAENYVFNGDRSTQNGYTAGLNLRWNFFDPLSYNAGSIASNNSNSSRYEFLAQQQNERAEIEFLNSQINALTQAVSLASKNDELMFKNVVVSQELFKNGAIVASNLSDAIMKYLDNFVYFANAQMELIDLYSKKVSKQKIDINHVLNQ